MGYVEITTRVVPASREALECFPLKDLREYAKALGVQHGRPTKKLIVDALLLSRATLCASLGD